MTRTVRQSFASSLRRAADPSRSAGSVMLLVVGVLLLVLIVGMTYMHVVQEDRRAGLTVDIDAIVLAQADLVGVKLIEDLSIGATGQHFADIHTNGTTNNTPDGLPDEEPYDYPGDVDKWLAATHPEGASTSWTQVSLLGDGFWNGTASTDTVRTLTAATAVGASKASNGAADADGDGIMDSKPEEAAIANRGGLLFFAWTRVEDMSSKANLNVWHSQVTSGGAYSAATDAPRWWYPGELDLGGLVSSLTGVNAQYTNGMSTDLPALMSQRGVSNSLPTPWGLGTAGQRGNSWLLNGKYYDNPQGSYVSLHLDASDAFDPTNELELRHRNGLVYLDNEANIESTGWFRNMLRGNVNSAESAWNDSIPGVSSVANYFTNEPRHQFTTYSGASIFRMPMGGDTSTPFFGKRDINTILTGASPASVLSTEISRVFGVGSPTLPSGLTAAQFADQMAANIVDYADDDNIVTLQNGRYGMEALPFITEIFSNVGYAVTAATGGPPNWSCTVAYTQPAYAIEIRNPVRNPISLENVRLVVDGATWGTLDTLASGATNLPADGKLPANRPLVLYRNGPSTHSTMTSYIDGSQTPITKAITQNWAAHAAGSTEMIVALQVQDSAGGWVTYQRFRHTRYNSAFTGPWNISSGTDPTGKHLMQASWTLGNGNGLNMLTVTQAKQSYTKTGLNFDSVDTTIDKLGVEAKGNTSAPDVMTATSDQLLIADRTDLSAATTPPIRHIGELFHIAAIGPTSTQAIADVWGTATSVSAFTMSPSSASTVSASVDYAVPHAVLLADRLTTLSPREDSADNDGDGSADNAEELFVPGTLNLNTAPEFLLDRVLPIGNATIRQAYVDAIIAYRDTPGATNRVNNYRAGRKGLAYVSEVYNLGSLANANNFGANGVSDYNGASFGSIQGDFLANPTTGDDGVIDDPEEKSLAARWIGQTCSTRSDVYCAYILVRGFTPGNLTTPVTERRAAVLLDRSRVADNDDGVRVLGIIWY